MEKWGGKMKRKEGVMNLRESEREGFEGKKSKKEQLWGCIEINKGERKR